MFYLIKVDCKLEQSSLISKCDNRPESLESLYMELEKYEKDHQVIVDRETTGKVKIYRRYDGIFISTKDLICYYNIVDYTDNASNLTKLIKKDKKNL